MFDCFRSISLWPSFWSISYIGVIALFEIVQIVYIKLILIWSRLRIIWILRSIVGFWPIQEDFGWIMALLLFITVDINVWVLTISLKHHILMITKLSLKVFCIFSITFISSICSRFALWFSHMSKALPWWIKWLRLRFGSHYGLTTWKSHKRLIMDSHYVIDNRLLVVNVRFIYPRPLYNRCLAIIIRPTTVWSYHIISQ